MLYLILITISIWNIKWLLLFINKVCLESDDPSVIMKAIDDFEIALKLAPSSPHTLYCLG